MTAAGDVATAAGLLATAAAGIRWLRVAQREHYIPGSTTRFAIRWWTGRPVDLAMVLVAAAGVVAAFAWSLAGLATAGAISIGPAGLSLRGRSSKLAWTRRMRALAAAWAVLQVAAVAGAAAAGVAPGVAAAGALAAPLLVDLACTLAAVPERRLSARYVRSATDRLVAVKPLVIGITGSFGKTSTKAYVAHLLSGRYAVAASPASYNNTAGLARTVNDHMPLGTEVLVAEMGTYGQGEIRSMCSWVSPRVAVITAIGPVHLERFGTEESILRAKAEITETAEEVVLNVDHPGLACLAARLDGTSKCVSRCSERDRTADVCVLAGHGGLEVILGGGDVSFRVERKHDAPHVAPGNVACAVAVALRLEVPVAGIEHLLGSLPDVPNRLSQYRSKGGFTILDDTYNSNPAGARSALELIREHAGPGSRLVVVTPGMVELGGRQHDENAAFASAASVIADDVVVVGRTNRRALLEGLGCEAAVNVVTVSTREGAVDWVRSHLGPGDAVLYENDLPDHFP